MKAAPVSVVIPAYNCGPWIDEAIGSVLAQTTPPGEVIVVDDGSTDDTANRARRYGGPVRYISQQNQGVSAARNRGVAQSASEFVAFLDADDVWHPRKLEFQMKAFESRPDLGLLGTAAFDWPAQDLPALDDGGGATPVPPVAVTWEQLAVKNRLITSSVVACRAALARAGDFDTGLQGPEDRDLWLRVAERAAVAYVPRRLTGYRMVQGSVSKQAATCHAGMRRILRKLDERRLWRGRRLLRRKAYGYMNHSAAYLYGAAGRPWKAIAHSLRSFAWYPLPYRPDEVGTRYERPKRLLLTLLRAARLKPADSWAGSVPSGQGTVAGRGVVLVSPQ